ncbi:unnamed protein product [Pleuronectes platessa]|uniref:Uncharacterized protein n=1 Tax=Pleuronectes platessa TaxID=8262 RepID=A0A9N7VKU2_PLEPL|nr:unnamed protein product [Pleuronectes platessa]
MIWQTEQHRRGHVLSMEITLRHRAPLAGSFSRSRRELLTCPNVSLAFSHTPAAGGEWRAWQRLTTIKILQSPPFPCRHKHTANHTNPGIIKELWRGRGYDSGGAGQMAKTLGHGEKKKFGLKSEPSAPRKVYGGGSLVSRSRCSTG